MCKNWHYLLCSAFWKACCTMISYAGYNCPLLFTVFLERFHYSHKTVVWHLIKQNLFFILNRTQYGEGQFTFNSPGITRSSRAGSEVCRLACMGDAQALWEFLQVNPRQASQPYIFLARILHFTFFCPPTWEWEHPYRRRRFEVAYNHLQSFQ